MSEASSISLGKETVSGSVAKFLLGLSGFLGTVVFAELLTPAEFGAVYALLSLANIIGRPMNGWAAGAKQRISAATVARPQLLGGVLTFNIVWITLVGIGTFLAQDLIYQYAPLAGAPLALWLVVATQNSYETVTMLAQGIGKVAMSVWIDAARAYVIVILQLLFVIAGFGAIGMIYGLTVASLVMSVVLIGILGIRVARPTVETLKTLAEYGKASIPGALAINTYSKLDILLLAVFASSTAAVGYYKVSLVLVTPGIIISGVAASGLMSVIAAHDADGNTEQVRTEIEEALSFTSLIALPILAGSIVLREELVTMAYGTEYAAANGAFLLLLAGHHLIQTKTAPLRASVRGADDPKTATLVMGGTVVFNFILGISLLTIIGPVGVAIATLIAEAGACTVFTWWFKTEYGGRIITNENLVQGASAAVMMGVVYWVHQVIPPVLIEGAGGRVSTAVVVGCGAVVYFAVLLMDTTHRNWLTSILPVNVA